MNYQELDKLDFGSLRQRSRLASWTSTSVSCTRRPQPRVGFGVRGAYACGCGYWELSTGSAAWGRVIHRCRCTNQRDLGLARLRSTCRATLGRVASGRDRWRPGHFGFCLQSGWSQCRFWLPTAIASVNCPFISVTASSFRPLNEGSVPDDRSFRVRVSIFLSPNASVGGSRCVNAVATRSKPGVWRPEGG